MRNLPEQEIAGENDLFSVVFKILSFFSLWIDGGEETKRSEFAADFDLVVGGVGQ